MSMTDKELTKEAAEKAATKLTNEDEWHSDTVDSIAGEIEPFILSALTKAKEQNEKWVDELAQSWEMRASSWSMQDPHTSYGAVTLVRTLRTCIKKLRAYAESSSTGTPAQNEKDAFKDFVHRRLDTAGVPKEFPDGEHTKEGCRIGDRLDWVLARAQQNEDAKRVANALRELLDRMLEIEEVGHRKDTGEYFWDGNGETIITDAAIDSAMNKKD